MIQRRIVHGDGYMDATFPDDTTIVSPGLSLPLPSCADIADAAGAALDEPLDRPPLQEQVHAGMKVTVAFDDPTVPCYAPVWAHALPLIMDRLERGGVTPRDVSLICANSLHRRFTLEELGRTIGDDFVRAHADRIRCHDAEDAEQMVHVGATRSGYDVVLSRSVVDADLAVYLNCSTTRGFSGGWKSVCVGLSGYASIRHHHTPDIMSMSLDRNRMHQILDEMGDVVDEKLGSERIFKLETILANPLQVHRIYGGSVAATRAKVIETLQMHQPARRDLVEEPVDVVVYGVPDWSPYAAFSHTNPILDMISTGLGYLGGMIEAIGAPGCTVILATPCPERWNMDHHPSYKEVWETVLPETRDPEVARQRYEPRLADNRRYIDAYRFGHAFHPVHATMALYPLKRLRHASRVIIAGPRDPSVPRHVGFDSAPSIEAALAEARGAHGPNAAVGLVEYPPAFNRG